MRSHGFPVQWTDRRVLLVKVVDARSGFAEEYTSSMAHQFMDSGGEKSDNMCALAEVL